MESGGSTKILDFRYDQSGAPYSLTYTVGSTSTVYYYITNLQGDVMYLVDSSGNQVAAYLYDPFGKVLSSSGTMAEINPLRYRGYYQDNETGFYYLQSRYYDPAICRFINADSYASTGQGLVGYNAFAYCLNSPITSVDPLGLWTISISVAASGMFGLGIALSFGFAFDSRGNVDWQYSYSIPGVDDTAMVCGVGAGVGIALQYTKADTVYIGGYRLTIDCLEYLL